MPIYEFGCKACRRKFEKIVPPGRTPATAPCPRCAKKAARLPSRFAVAGATAKSGAGDDWGEGQPGEDGADRGEGEGFGEPGDDAGDDAFDG